MLYIEWWVFLESGGLEINDSYHVLFPPKMSQSQLKVLHTKPSNSFRIVLIFKTEQPWTVILVAPINSELSIKYARGTRIPFPLFDSFQVMNLPDCSESTMIYEVLQKENNSSINQRFFNSYGELAWKNLIRLLSEWLYSDSLWRKATYDEIHITLPWKWNDQVVLLSV